MIFHETELEQKSQNWLDFRKDKIGSSEISVLTGDFPLHWCDQFELFERKMGKEYEINNEYINVGNLHEPRARKYVEYYLKNKDKNPDDFPICRNVYDRTRGFEVEDPKFEQYTVQNKEFPQVFSSYDGLDIKNKIVLEIKCPSQGTFTKILKNRVPTIPRVYKAQTQMQLMIANSHWGITRGIFAVFFQDGVYFTDKKTKEIQLIRLILVETEYDEEYCKNLLSTCKKFVTMLESKCWMEDWNK